MNVKKLLTPLRIKSTYIYPKTVASQVQMDDDQTKTIDQVAAEKVAKSELLSMEEIQAAAPSALTDKAPEASAVRVLNDQLVNLVKFKEVQLASDGTANLITKPVPTETGYKAVAIGGWLAYGSKAGGADIYDLAIDINRQNIQYGWYPAVTANTVGCTVILVYVKESVLN